MRILDKRLFDKELRGAMKLAKSRGEVEIRGKGRGKMASRERGHNNSTSSNKTPKPTQQEVPTQEEKQIEATNKTVQPLIVISGTQGLADYLGCSKSMAFSIIKSGVLKQESIQYMVGKCWKFNRKKLDEHLKKNPDMLSRIRCEH